MPQLHINCIFKSSGNRLFKVSKTGGSEGVLCWWIQEVQEVKHDSKTHIEAVGELFHRSKKEMEAALGTGKIEIVKIFNNF